jgi:hypothetical protein
MSTHYTTKKYPKQQKRSEGEQHEQRKPEAFRKYQDRASDHNKDEYYKNQFDHGSSILYK